MMANEGDEALTNNAPNVAETVMSLVPARITIVSVKFCILIMMGTLRTEATFQWIKLE